MWSVNDNIMSLQFLLQYNINKSYSIILWYIFNTSFNLASMELWTDDFHISFNVSIDHMTTVSWLLHVNLH